MTVGNGEELMSEDRPGGLNTATRTGATAADHRRPAATRDEAPRYPAEGRGFGRDRNSLLSLE